MTNFLIAQGKKLAVQAAKDAMKDGSKKEKGKGKQKLGKDGDPVDEIVRATASVVGFVEEVVQYRREKKAVAAKVGDGEGGKAERLVGADQGCKDSSADGERIDGGKRWSSGERERHVRWAGGSQGAGSESLGERQAPVVSGWGHTSGNEYERGSAIAASVQPGESSRSYGDVPERETSPPPPYEATASPEQVHETICQGVDSKADVARRKLQETVRETAPRIATTSVLGERPTGTVRETARAKTETVENASLIPSSSSTSTQKEKDPSNLALGFLKRHPYDPSTRTSALDLPIVIAQRRPRKRSRGFVRAYSPVLASVDIDQPTFLDFLDTFNESLEPNPYLNAIDLAAIAGEAVPEPFVLLIDAAVGYATEMAIEAQSRFTSGRFLDRVNLDFFIPRGLVCVVATWRGDENNDDNENDADGASSSNSAQRPQQPLMPHVGFEGQTTRAVVAQPSLVQQLKDLATQKTSTDALKRGLQAQMHGKMRNTGGTFASSAPAPLVFPSAEETDATIKTGKDGKRKNAFSRGEVWLDGFMDKHAQATWIGKNPTFGVASSMPRPKFRSKYADPNHPAASGDLVAFATAGRWSTKGRIETGDQVGYEGGEEEMERTPDEGLAQKELQKRKKEEEKWAKEEEKEAKKEAKKKAKEKKSEEQKGFVSLLQQNVLYLVIVNLLPKDVTYAAPGDFQDATKHGP